MFQRFMQATSRRWLTLLLIRLSSELIDGTTSTVLAQSMPNPSKPMSGRIGSGNILYEQGQIELATGQYKKAAQDFQQVIAMANQTRDRKLKGKALGGLGDAYMHLGDRNKVLAYHLEALAINRRVNPVEEARNLNGIGVVLRKQNKLGEAIDCFQQALVLNQRLKQDRKSLTNLLNLADTYSLKKEYPQAVQSLKTGFALSQKTRNIDDQMACGIVAGEVYERMGKLDKALSSFQQAAALTTPNQYGDLIGLKFNIARLLRVKKQFDASNRVAISAYGLSQRAGTRYFQMELDALIAQNYASLDNRNQAYDYLVRHNTIKDSLFNEERAKQINELQTRYETEKKEQSIQTLTQQNQLQRARNEQQKLKLVLTFVTAIGLLLVLIVLYSRYRLKKQSMLVMEQQRAALHEQKTEIERQNAQKEILLKEIHHRVKNNLQIVLSLLDSQTETLKETSAITAIRESQSRVQAMALIHQNLYPSDTNCDIEMENYVQSLTNYLLHSINLNPHLSIKLAVEPIVLDISTAMPLGLIINEAVTNACKYAFPDNREGVITLKLNRLGPTTYRLIIEDDGIGIPDGFDLPHSGSLGMRLIEGLTEQLDGTVQIKTQPGFRLQVNFKQALTMTTVYESQR